MPAPLPPTPPEPPAAPPAPNNPAGLPPQAPPIDPTFFAAPLPQGPDVGFAQGVLPQQIPAMPMQAAMTPEMLAAQRAQKMANDDYAQMIRGLRFKETMGGQTVLGGAFDPQSMVSAEYLKQLGVTPFDMVQVRDPKTGEMVAVENKGQPGALKILPSMGISKKDLTNQEAFFLENPKAYAPTVPKNQRAALKAYEAKVNEFRETNALIHKLNKAGGSEELKRTAYHYGEDQLPPQLQQKIAAGEVFHGRNLPPWLLKQNPDLAQLYWYRNELSPDMVKLMDRLHGGAKPKKGAK